MKKTLIILLLNLFVLPTYAGGVGYINYEKFAENYIFAKNSMKEFEVKGSEIKQYLVKKEQEFAKLETPLQKQKFEEKVREELKAKEDAFNKFRETREEEVYNKIHAVAEKIRLEKDLDVLIDARSVFSGGIDITDDLIKKLNHVK